MHRVATGSLLRAVPGVLGKAGTGLHASPLRPQLLCARRTKLFTAVTENAEASTSRVELPKNFDVSSEEARYDWWESSGHFKPSGSGDPYVISMPPPNVTGKLHMGHAMFVTLQDIMIRTARMQGKNALWLPGTDHAGIATQMVVEKMINAQGITRQEMGREAFTEKTWEWKEEYGGAISRQIRRLGASCDWSRERFTLDDTLSAAVVEAFVRLHKDGLIYKGSYMVNWAPKLQTAVSDLEVEYSDEPGTLYFFKYPLADGGPDDYLPVATTRPETILGDTAVAVHPEDDRYKAYVGKDVEVPMSGGRRIKVIADDYVDMEFGTGALKITPGHDPNDYEIGKRCGLETINIMNKDASMNANAGEYQGLSREECRKKLWADLEAAELVIRKEPYQLRVPRSQRGGEVIEPLVSDQWYVKMDALAKPALAAVADGDIKIYPQRFEKIYNNWLDNIQDWCISRQLWWGHRIPVYYVFADEETAEASGGVSDKYVVAKSESEALEQARAEHGPDVVLRQETDVLDTWFSSGLWPFSTLGWPDEEAEDFKTFYPTQMMETGHDILFFWVARMIMMGMYLTGKVPFDTIFLHGLVRDEKGRKMSKSLGNVVDPVDTIADYGTDALRYTLATGTSPGQDLNLSLDRVTASRNFTNKIWNAGKYILFNLSEASDEEFAELAKADFSTPEAMAELPLVERWIVSSLHEVVDRSTQLHAKYDFGEAGRVLYEFFWSEYADWFIESSKARSYGDDPAAKQRSLAVAAYVYDKVLKLAHPYMPYITEELWQAMPHEGDALITAPWPATGAAVDGDSVRMYGTLQSTVTAVRNARAEYGVEPGRKIAATLAISDPALKAALEAEADVIALLAKLDPAQLEIVDARESSEGTIEVAVSGEVQVYLPMAGLFDAAKEMARLEKQKGKIEKELGGLKGRLNNEKFMANAPEKVVAEVKEQAAALEEQMKLVLEKYEVMAKNA